MRTEWGVTIGIKKVPNPQIVTFPDKGIYGWKIDKHGLYILANSKDECIQQFKDAYLSETGETIE